MSDKYIKLEDVIHNLNMEITGRIEYTETMKANLFFAIDRIPTIEVSEDYISRKAIMKYIADTQLGLDPYKEEDDRVKVVLDWIFDEAKNAPSVIPSRPRGEWLLKEPHSVYAFFTCSVCGRENEYKTDFCPHCGADMKGEGE